MKSHEIIITTESEEFCRFYDSIFGSETPIWKLEKSFFIKSTRKKIKLILMRFYSRTISYEPSCNIYQKYTVDDQQWTNGKCAYGP